MGCEGPASLVLIARLVLYWGSAHGRALLSRSEFTFPLDVHRR